MITWPDNKHLTYHYYGNMSRDEWLVKRESLGTLGGSDVAAILGLNKYVSPAMVFYRKVGVAPPRERRETLHMAFGHMLEDMVAKAWECYDEDEEVMRRRIMSRVEGRDYDNGYGKAVPHCYLITNSQYPFLHATIDRAIMRAPASARPWLDEDISMGILECKIISPHIADMWDDGVPPYYYDQVMTYMIVTGCRYAEIALMRGNNQLIVQPVPYDETRANAIIMAAASFMAAVRDGRQIVADIMADNPGQPFYDEYNQLTPLGEEAVQALDPILPDTNDLTEEYMQFLSLRQINMEGRHVEVDEHSELHQLAMEAIELQEKVKRSKEVMKHIRKIMIKEDIGRVDTPDAVISLGKSLRVTKKKKI
ncbi:MAG: hypothetical protein D6746_05135 [Bacteroidetes bacterium]|nr:MAG: hypothetical protein D6746_05135 [Bacteroidota bacterium]